MVELDLQQNNERKLYRELFINAQNAFKELTQKLKSDFSCHNCGQCCKIRYSQLPPEEIFRLANEEDDQISKEYIKLFTPYAEQEDFIYGKDKTVSIEQNNKQAENINKEYFKQVLSKHSEPVYFYYCKSCKDIADNQTADCKKNVLCENFPNSVTTILPEQCNYRHWQNLVKHKIETEIEPDINLKIKEILDYKDKFNCKKTGTCCRLACSEFSYEELKHRALNNDEFATQFTSIFIPYENIEDARQVFPEYVDLVLSKLDEGETTNFYHCKHLQGSNTCPIYKDRPQICRDFPDNPFSIIHPFCGYYQWKEDVLVAAYNFQAMSQIYNFYLDKINAAIK